VPQTALLATDRLAVRIYVNNSGRTIKLHTENNHLCQVITTFSTGITALNGLTDQVQNLAVGTSGTDFAINSATGTHTFNLPTASATNRGALSSADWSTFDGKQNALGFTPENVANKSDSFTASSTTTYANTKALVDGLATKQNTLVLAADYTDVAFTASQTAERIIRTLFIPKGTLPIGRTLKLSALVSKTGTASTTALRIRVGTSATPSPLSSAPLIAYATGIPAVNTFFPFLRNFIHIQSATTISTGANATLDTIQSTISIINADWANVDYWLILTCEHNIISADAYTSYELILSL
jgi:hypothetical protein